MSADAALLRALAKDIGNAAKQLMLENVAARLVQLEQRNARLKKLVGDTSMQLLDLEDPYGRIAKLRAKMIEEANTS